MCLSQDLKMKTKDNLLQIKCENSKSTIKGISSKEFPIIPKIKGEPIMKIEALKLKQAFSQVVNFASSSDIRPEISGIFIDFDSNKIKFVATDSFRLGEKTVSLKGNKNKNKKSVIIPLRTIQELIRILGEQNKEEMVEILVEQNQILFKMSNTQIVSRLIEGSYPNYGQLISKQFETKLVLDKNEFLNTVKISSLFSGKINDLRLKVVPKKSLVEIFSQDAEIGENISELKGEISGKETEVIFNHKYLLDGLNNIDSNKIMFGLNGNTNPGILKPIGDSSFTYIIMPIKL